MDPAADVPKRPHGIATGGMKSKSGGPRVGCAVRKVGVVCMVRFRGGHARGGATARGLNIAGRCPHPTGGRVPLFRRPDTGGRKRRVASSDTGWALRWQCGNARALDYGSERPSRIRKAARHRPVSTLTLTGGRRWPHTRGKDGSGGWLGRSTRQGSRKGIPFRLILLPAEPAGAPPPPSSCRTLPQAPGGLPPAWTGTYAIHPVTGAASV